MKLKSNLFAKFALATLFLTFAIGAFAAQKSITLYSDSTLNGQKVAAGDYKLDYQISGSTAEVKLLQSKKVVASATGQVVDAETPAAQTAVVRSTSPDGSSSIVEIQLANQKSSIRFAPEAADKGN
jgi:hypothetical protein